VLAHQRGHRETAEEARALGVDSAEASSLAAPAS